ncbi:MAG: MFS transporter [Candidatus Heimdallarchaeota archaeon]|nr:MFS transporter [Candidatus Heimdallarchaeota archaeon]
MSTSHDLIDDDVKSSLYKLNKPRYAAWVLYDVANTFYANGILTLIAATWLVIVLQENGYSYDEAGSIFGVLLSITGVFMAVLLPILGAISDVKQERRNFVLLFSGICIISVGIFAYSNNLWVVMIFFAISMISYQWAQMFYDSMLPGVVPPGKEARLSSIAIALGYFGGAMITVYSYILSVNENAPVDNPENGAITLGYFPKLIIPIMIGFALLTLPLIRVKETDWSKIRKIIHLKDDDGELSEDEIKDIADDVHPSILKSAMAAFGELWGTLKDIKKTNIGMFYYIIAYFIIADLANLITLITALYFRGVLGMAESEYYTLLAVTGAGLIFLSYFIGRICDRYGAKRGFQTIGVLWIVSLTIFILEGVVLERYTLYIAALLMGPALSGVWISQRQMVLELVPNEESLGRYFGLTKFSGKLSSAVGPALFFGVKAFFGTIWDDNATPFRMAILFLTILLIIGFIILQVGVPNKHIEFKAKKQRMLEALKDIN